MTKTSSPSEIEVLLQRLEAQEAEIQHLKALVEPGGNGHEQPERPVRSRRDVLKMAGAAVLGAAGASAMQVIPAQAANGGNLLIGSNNQGTATTYLFTTGADSFYSQAATTGIGVLGVTLGPGPLGVGVRAFADAANAIGIQGMGVTTGCVGGQFSGVRAPINVVPATAAGPPTTTAHSVGDLWTDSAGVIWACLTAGTPGVFAPLQTGGANITHFAKVQNTQYHLTANDGKTWVDMDATNLVLTITPLFNAQAVISINTDLWTANGGFNQDLGVFISGGAYAGGSIVAWKEAGGPGTFAPNAAFVETTQPMVAGTTYTVKARWKCNQPQGAATIYAGAGPLAAGAAGGGVAGQISPTRLAAYLVADTPSPAVLTIPANNPSALPPASRPVGPDGRNA
jgi:hypothetical protein